MTVKPIKQEDEEADTLKKMSARMKEKTSIGLCRSVKLLRQAKPLPLRKCKRSLRISSEISNAETTPP